MRGGFGAIGAAVPAGGVHGQEDRRAHLPRGEGIAEEVEATERFKHGLEVIQGLTQENFEYILVEMLFCFFIRPHLSQFVIRLKKPTGHWLSIQFVAPNWLDNQ